MQRQARQQEQMFDQFQQVMTMIVQRFGDKHRDEMRVVREEITQIRQLSGELQSLHSRLSSQPPHAPPVPSPSPPRGSPPRDANAPRSPTRRPPRGPPLGVAGPPPVDREWPVGSGACSLTTGRGTPSAPVGKTDRGWSRGRVARGDARAHSSTDGGPGTGTEESLAEDHRPDEGTTDGPLRGLGSCLIRARDPCRRRISDPPCAIMTRDEAAR